MDSTFQFFNSPSSSSASSVCGDEDDNMRSEEGNSDSHGFLTNDCDINFPLNQFNESTMNEFEDCPKGSSEASNNTPGQTNSSALILEFSHTANLCTSTASSDDETINSPLDIYRHFGKPHSKCIYVLSLHLYLLIEIFKKMLIANWFYFRCYCRYISTTSCISTAHSKPGISIEYVTH